MMAKKQKEAKSRNWVVIILLVILVIAIGKLVYLGMKPQNESDNTPLPPASPLPTLRIDKASVTIQDPLDSTGMHKTYKEENGLFEMKYPTNWSRVIIESGKYIKRVEFFVDGTTPIYHEADGVGNDVFRITINPEKLTLEDIRNIYKSQGTTDVVDVKIGGKPALKNHYNYNIKLSHDMSLQVYSPDGEPYQEVLNSFIFYK